MKHLNEATIQAFLDAELTDEAMERVTKHFALCEKCANALLKAEAEQEEVNLAFAAEVASPCPSQRIWARIENEIDCLGASGRKNVGKAESKSLWQLWSNIFSPAQIAFAAGLAAVILVSLFALQALREIQPKPADDTQIAENQNTNIVKPDLIDNIAVVAPTPGINRAVSENPKPTPARALKVSYQPKINRPKIENRKSLEVLPEEHDYLNSIAQLSKAVNASDEFIMRPSFRVDYERNLAVMDSAISAMQKQVRSHPKDENAKRILFASYQNKIELLNTVAEKSQMIASLR